MKEFPDIPFAKSKKSFPCVETPLDGNYCGGMMIFHHKTLGTKEEVKEEKPFIPNEQHYDAEFIQKFVEDNYSWLEKWFDNPVNYLTLPYRPKEYSKQIEGFQKFRKLGDKYNPEFPLIDWVIEKATKTFLHKEEILINAVFSKFSKLSYSDNYGGQLYNMSGFVEQMGRLPNKNDKVRFLYCGADSNGARFLRLKTNSNDTEFELLSDCKIEIMKGKKLSDTIGLQMPAGGINLRYPKTAEKSEFPALSEELHLVRIGKNTSTGEDIYTDGKVYYYLKEIEKEKSHEERMNDYVKKFQSLVWLNGEEREIIDAYREGKKNRGSNT